MLARPELSPEAEADLRLLNGVRDLIEAGWIKGMAWRRARDGAGHDLGASYCLLGATVAVATNGAMDLGLITGRFQDHVNGKRHDLARLLGLPDPLSVLSFNDNPETTKADVLDRLDMAIDRRTAECLHGQS